MGLRNFHPSCFTMCDISSRSYTSLESQIFYCLVYVQGIMAGTGAELPSAALAQGIMVALKMKFYFCSLCTSLDIALPKIIPTPLSPDELLENTTGKTTFKL